MSDYTDYIKQMLQLAQQTISANPLLINETGINVKGDKTIGMDILLEKKLIDYVRNNNLAVDIFSEEVGLVKYHPQPTHLLVFDPLDGSTNYKIGKNLLPYGIMIALFEGNKPLIKNVIASGAWEQTTNQGWVYDGQTTTDLTGIQIKLKDDWEINRSTPIYLDLYYHEAYRTFLPLAEKLHIRWTGSNIGALLYLLSNVSAGMGARLMRPEEIGTVVSLITGAGGICFDHQGNDLNLEKFSTQRTYQLLAGTERIVKFVLKQIKQ